MTEGEEVKRWRRRSSQEIQQRVAEFRTSGLGQSEFCQRHNLALGTLQRGLRRRRMKAQGPSEAKWDEGGGIMGIAMGAYPSPFPEK